MFNSSRLKIARQRLGLTITKLAQVSGVSARSLTSYESGTIQPSLENLLKLAKALSVPESFFDRDDIEAVPIEAASFRKLSKTTALRRDAVLAEASLAVEFFDLISEKFKLPESSISTLDKLDPEQAAELTRRQWQLGDRPIGNIIHLLESRGVRIAALGHENADIDAFCFQRDQTPFIFVNTSRSGERQRFDLAHELGHFVLHSELEMEPSRSKQREAEANQFAAAFLMPKSGILAQRMDGANLERILLARSYWKVSAMALTHRLHELNLLNNWQYRTHCVTLSDLGYRTTEPGGIIPESSLLLRKVMFGSKEKVTLREAAAALDQYPDGIRAYVRDLVPVAA